MGKGIGGGMACGSLTCGFWIGLILLNLSIGAWSIQYLCSVWLHKSIAFGWAMLMGLFLAELSIPAAIVTWIAKKAGLIAMAMSGFLPV